MIIGLGYKARSGKSSVGNWLDAQRGFNSTCFAFSLKEAVKVIYGWTDEHVHGKLKETECPFWKVTPRLVMQKFGTEACRYVLQDDIWIRSLERRISGAPNADWVITDCRFPNEADFVHSKGGFMIRLDRDTEGLISLGATKHSSETAMDEYKGWDFTISNNGNFNELFTRIDQIIETTRSITR